MLFQDKDLTSSCIIIYVTSDIGFFNNCKKKHAKHITYKHLYRKYIQHRRLNCKTKLLQEIFTFLY